MYLFLFFFLSFSPSSLPRNSRRTQSAKDSRTQRKMFNQKPFRAGSPEPLKSCSQKLQQDERLRKLPAALHPIFLRCRRVLSSEEWDTLAYLTSEQRCAALGMQLEGQHPNAIVAYLLSAAERNREPSTNNLSNAFRPALSQSSLSSSSAFLPHSNSRQQTPPRSRTSQSTISNASPAGTENVRSALDLKHAQEMHVAKSPVLMLRQPASGVVHGTPQHLMLSAAPVLLRRAAKERTWISRDVSPGATPRSSSRSREVSTPRSGCDRGVSSVVFCGTPSRKPSPPRSASSTPRQHSCHARPSPVRELRDIALPKKAPAAELESPSELRHVSPVAPLRRLSPSSSTKSAEVHTGSRASAAPTPEQTVRQEGEPSKSAHYSTLAKQTPIVAGANSCGETATTPNSAKLVSDRKRRDSAVTLILTPPREPGQLLFVDPLMSTMHASPLSESVASEDDKDGPALLDHTVNGASSASPVRRAHSQMSLLTRKASRATVTGVNNSGRDSSRRLRDYSAATKEEKSESPARLSLPQPISPPPPIPAMTLIQTGKRGSVVGTKPRVQQQSVSPRVADHQSSPPSHAATSPSPSSRVSPSRASKWMLDFQNKLKTVGLDVTRWQQLTAENQEEFFVYWRMSQLQVSMVRTEYRAAQ